MYFIFNILTFLFGLILYLFITRIWKMNSPEGIKKQDQVIDKSGRLLRFIAIGSMAISVINIFVHLNP